MVRSCALALVLSLSSGAAACGDGSDRAGDRAAFCDAVERLAADDPFADLAVASPGEMKSAFVQLRDGAAAIDASAPPDVQVQTSRYVDAVNELIRQLAGAGYDPRALDPLSYGRAVDGYTAAATSVTNAANATCG